MKLSDATDIGLYIFKPNQLARCDEQQLDFALIIITMFAYVITQYEYCSSLFTKYCDVSQEKEQFLIIGYFIQCECIMSF